MYSLSVHGGHRPTLAPWSIATATRAERACPSFWSAFHSGYTGATVKNTEIRNETEVPLTLADAVFNPIDDPFLHGDTEEDLVARVPIQERVPCGTTAAAIGTSILLSVWRTRERNFVSVGPPDPLRTRLVRGARVRAET